MWPPLAPQGNLRHNGKGRWAPVWVTACSLDTGPTAGHSSQHVFVGLLLGREKKRWRERSGGGQMDA